MSEPSLEGLPSEIILQIFSSLDYRDLVNISYLNHRLRDLAAYPARWKTLCQKYWLVNECPYNMTWKEQFISFYVDMGRYINCYASIRTSWLKIMDFMNLNCPKIWQTVNEGISEEHLNLVENLLRLKLPNDLRCSYRIHNGQKLSSLGLMGSMNIHTHHRSESLLDMDAIIACDPDREGLRGCIPVTFCIRTGTSQYLAITDEEGYDVNTVFYLAGNEMNSGSSFFMYPFQTYNTNRDAFITAKSFQEWLSNYATFLVDENPDVGDHQLYLFHHDPVCIATSGFISVSVATFFMPELSKVTPPEFFHTYRITMSMSIDAPPLDAYQLETRHWTITDEYGRERTVSGNGVGGQYPVLVPGADYTWISCTTFSTTYGSMKGYFMLRNIATGDRLKVVCPIFHVKSLPYITAESRASNREAQKRKKSGSPSMMDLVSEHLPAK